jgi:hypothetical protein
VHEEVLNTISYVLGNDDGLVRDDDDDTVIDVSFLALFKDLEYFALPSSTTLSRIFLARSLR